jgi:N-sulfoglucosamine sulfohydrolase
MNTSAPLPTAEASNKAKPAFMVLAVTGFPSVVNAICGNRQALTPDRVLAQLPVPGSFLFMRLLPVVCAIVLSVGTHLTRAADRPNILWITTEDMSPTLGCYGDAFARTPALDAFAKESIRFTHAFATAPVCSPSRSCLITGMYATSLGTQRLRCQEAIPPDFKGFPQYLRNAGYFTSNNVKTDYNLANEAAFIRETWNESSAQAHWRQRQPGQPFFSVFNLMITHQSRTSAWTWEDFEKEIQPHLSANERSDPAKVPLPPYYPDTPTSRRTMSRFYDCVAAMDKLVAGILQQLADDGLAEDTIVFFYSDHGSGLPRHKRLLHDSGMRVPLMIRFPKKWQHLAPARPGEITTRLVSFVDFAPTVLGLAGLAVPPHMEGTAFLGPNAGKPRTHVFGARDRVDEAFDVARSVRDQRWLYIRNYLPHLSWHQPEWFSDQSDMRREITSLATEGRLNAAQLTYAAPTRPREELYDTQRDPHQIHNLAADPKYAAQLSRMRKLQRDWTLQTRDLGFLPEAEQSIRSQGRTPCELARDNEAYPLERILAAAELVGDPKALEQQIKLLSDSESAVRYWAAVGLRAQGEAGKSATGALEAALKDTSASVRIEAAGALAVLSDSHQTALKVLGQELNGRDWHSAVHAARTLQLLGEKARPALPMMKTRLAEVGPLAKQNDQAMFIQFALDAAVKRLESKTD